MLKTLTNIAIQAAPANTVGETTRPEFYRLPKTGNDPFFGLTRSHYYELEKWGKLKLVRLRRPGAGRGVTLVPYAAVAALLHAAHDGRKS